MITGERIRNIREDKDILQQELADAVGINVSVLSRIEKGTRQLRDDELVKIADKLNVSVDYLLGRTDEPGGFQKGDGGDEDPLVQKAGDSHLVMTSNALVDSDTDDIQRRYSQLDEAGKAAVKNLMSIFENAKKTN